MRVLLQRVRSASVTVDREIVGEIDDGLLVLVGVGRDESVADIEWLANKVVNMRVFPDDVGVMNRSVIDVGGDVLAVSQFTLFASTAKGNRPSYTAAAPGDVSKPLFDQFLTTLSAALGKPVSTGVFGADMQVALVNDGPITIWLDSKNRT